jgi:phosphoglycolate phosphatase-like HAD superfamily hydrolase
MSVPGAVVLDFDGVLVESNEMKTRAFEDLAALYPEHSKAMMAYHLANFSRPRHEKFEHFVNQLMGRPGDEGLLQRMGQQFSDLVVSRVVASPFVHGAEAFLEIFSRRLPLYVSSVTPQDELRRIIRMRGMESYFQDIYGDPPRSKVEAIRYVLSQHALTPSQLIFVGDSPSDFRAATETGVEFLGRDSGQPFEGIELDLFRDMHAIRDELHRRLSD